MPELRGFPADEALWRLLRARGHEGGLQAFRDRHPGTASGGPAEALVGPLAAEGLQARVALLETADLRHLELPTLVQLGDGGWILLAGRGREGCALETADGPRRLGPEALAGLLSGRALDLAPGLPPGPGLWARLGPLFRPQRKLLLGAVAATLLLQLLALATPLVTAAVLDRALPDGAEALLATLLAGLALAAAHQAWIGWLRDRILLCVATRVAVSAERGCFEHLLRCPFRFLQERTQGQLMQALGGFEAARNLLPLKTLGVFMNGGLALVYLAAMVRLLPGPAAVVLAATLALALGTLLAGRAQARLEALQVEAGTREHGLLIELVAGIGTVKAAGAEGRGLAQWRLRCRRVLELGLARGRIALGWELAQGLARQAQTIALLGWGGLKLLDGSLRVGQLFGFLQVAAGFSGNVTALANLGLALLVLRPQLARAQEILELAPDPLAPGPGPDSGPVPAALEGVWFRYAPEAPWVLEGCDLRLEPGEKRTLDGPSGSGKSTILRLLAGLLEPDRGRVRVAGRRPAEARQVLAYLPQAVQLLGGTLLENLQVFAHGAPMERILEACRETGLQELVDELPMGLRTFVPPRAATLSGGQRQLVALTGTLASDRPLLLLDEALANLDPVRAGRLRRLLWRRDGTLLEACHGAPGFRP